MPQFKDKEDFCKQTNVRPDKDLELIQFAYANLNHLPFAKDDKAAYENYERMISGMIYNDRQKDLFEVRLKCRDYMLDYGDFRTRQFQTMEDYQAAKTNHLKSFIGHVGEGTYMEHPIYFDYGFNTYLGKNFYSNYNLTILDVSIVKIGDNVMCGPNVSILTPNHPVDPTLRYEYLENALPVTIGNGVWLGGSCTILGGVTVGDGSVVAAGAVVNKDVPPNTVVAGVPARVVKTIEARDPDFDIQAELRKHSMDHID
ncbi:Galactoside O-acetyltransferase [Candida viswanathii]|uniref:Galactoside O-acetyltransferase n=1 Tax=Candida viswanathii TaxID=5486 RepID=A0A367XWD1_9ASCO|nr:Galactoside O-acetyltransferase [Candida viswanathii]